MARPNLGVRAPVFRLPGIGGRSKGAGEDILGGLMEFMLVRGFEISAASFFVLDLLLKRVGCRNKSFQSGVLVELPPQQ